MTATPPILVTLLKAEAETPTLRTPTTALLSIQETDSNGTITQATFQPRRKDAYGPEIATGTGAQRARSPRSPLLHRRRGRSAHLRDGGEGAGDGWAVVGS